MPEPNPEHRGGGPNFLETMRLLLQRLAREAASQQVKQEEIKRAQKAVDKTLQKVESKRWMQKAVSHEGADRRDAINQVEKPRADDIKAAPGILREAWSLAQAEGQTPDWLVRDPARIEHIPAAAEYAWRIAVLPPELRDDPHVLYREAVRAYQYMDWQGSPNSEVKQMRKLLDNTLDRVHRQLAQESRAKAVTREELDRGLSQHFDIYESHKFPDGVDRNSAPVQELEEILLGGQDDLHYSAVPSEEKRNLEQIKREIVGTIRDNSGDAEYKELAEGYVELVNDQLRVSDVEGKWVTAKTEEKQPIETTPYYPQKELPENWLYQGVNDGEPPTDQATANLLSEVKEVNFNNSKSSEDAHKKFKDRRQEILDDYVAKLGAIDTLDQTTADGLRDQLKDNLKTIDKYKDNFVRAYMKMNTEDFQRREVYKPETILDPEKREKEFYNLLKKLLSDPQDSSRNLLTLNEETAFTHFINLIYEIPDDGPSIAIDFLQRKEIITSLHDVDFQARQGNVDMKQWVGTMSYFQNEYAQYALTDPVVVAYLQSLEEAATMIIQNNDGYAPNDMFSYNGTTKRNEWDEQAKKILREKVRAGMVRKVKIDARTGLRDSNADIRSGDVGEALTEAELDDQSLKYLATLQMAKGMGIVNLHLVKIFAFSKIPMIAGQDTQKILSSIPYEGLGSKMNMLGWMLRFRMGGDFHYPFFFSMIGVEGDDIMNYLKHDPKKWTQILDAAQGGVLGEFMKKEYEDKGKKMPKRVADMIDAFKFLGRIDVHSGWAAVEGTLGMDELQLESLGTALRLNRASSWAERQVKGDWLEHHLGKGWKNGKSDLEIDFEINKRQREWSKVQHEDKTLEEKIDKYAKAYRAHIWLQAVMRNPTYVAQHVEVPQQKLLDRKLDQQFDKKISLRNLIIHDILGINVITEVASERTEHDSHYKRRNAERINILEGDLLLVKKVAMNGENGKRAPRDIKDQDFDLIAGDGKSIIWIDGFGKEHVITAETRRKEAREFWKQVQQRLLGESSSVQDWKNWLGIPNTMKENVPDTERERVEQQKYGIKKYTLEINGKDDIEEILHEHGKGTLFTDSFLGKGADCRSNLDDVDWSRIDYMTLGGRAWARRAIDMSVRAGSSDIIGNYLTLLVGKPDEKAMTKTLTDLKNSEKNHDVDEANKFVYLLTRATDELYRQRAFGSIPLLGRIIGTTKLRPLSIAQMVKSPMEATFWSANNVRAFNHEVADATGMPEEHVDPSGKAHSYNLEKLDKETGATRRIALAEMALVGGSMVMGGLFFAAIAQGVRGTADDEKKH